MSSFPKRKRSDFCFFALYRLGLKVTKKTKVYRGIERIPQTKTRMGKKTDIIVIRVYPIRVFKIDEKGARHFQPPLVLQQPLNKVPGTC